MEQYVSIFIVIEIYSENTGFSVLVKSPKSFNLYCNRNLFRESPFSTKTTHYSVF